MGNGKLSFCKGKLSISRKKVFISGGKLSFKDEKLPIIPAKPLKYGMLTNIDFFVFFGYYGHVLF